MKFLFATVFLIFQLTSFAQFVRGTPSKIEFIAQDKNSDNNIAGDEKQINGEQTALAVLAGSQTGTGLLEGLSPKKESKGRYTCASGQGNRDYFFMSMPACNSSSCNFEVGKNYSIFMEFKPRITESAIYVNFTAAAQAPSKNGNHTFAIVELVQKPPSSFYPANKYNSTFGIVLPSNVFSNRTGNYTLEVKLYNPGDKHVIACEYFSPVKISNAGTSLLLSLFASLAIPFALVLNYKLF